MRTLEGQVTLVTGSSRATVDGNLLVTFLTLKSFLPGMKERRRGCVITVGSAAGRRADARSPLPYAAAAFLASDDAAWITGVVLDVAGGAVFV